MTPTATMYMLNEKYLQDERGLCVQTFCDGCGIEGGPFNTVGDAARGGDSSFTKLWQYPYGIQLPSRIQLCDTCFLRARLEGLI